MIFFYSYKITIFFNRVYIVCLKLKHLFGYFKKSDSSLTIEEQFCLNHETNIFEFNNSSNGFPLRNNAQGW